MKTYERNDPKYIVDSESSVAFVTEVKKFVDTEIYPSADQEKLRRELMKQVTNFARTRPARNDEEVRKDKETRIGAAVASAPGEPGLTMYHCVLSDKSYPREWYENIYGSFIPSDVKSFWAFVLTD